MTENQKDILRQPPFADLLIELSDKENPVPLNPNQINITDLRNSLIFSGVKLNEIENSPELFDSISKSKFRDFETGRGPAVEAAFGGRENALKYQAWAIEKSVDQPKLSKGDESSKARGLMQFAADTIALAAGTITKEEYSRKVNWRVGKKFQKDEIVAQVFGLPTDPEGQQKLKETSSMPKGSAIEACKFILALNK